MPRRNHPKRKSPKRPFTSQDGQRMKLYLEGLARGPQEGLRRTMHIGRPTPTGVKTSVEPGEPEERMP